MLLTAHCLRTSDGDFTAESRQLLEETARNARLAHTLLHAPKFKPSRQEAQ